MLFVFVFLIVIASLFFLLPIGVWKKSSLPPPPPQSTVFCSFLLYSYSKQSHRHHHQRQQRHRHRLSNGKDKRKHARSPNRNGIKLIKTDVQQEHTCDPFRYDTAEQRATRQDVHFARCGTNQPTAAMRPPPLVRPTRPPVSPLVTNAHTNRGGWGKKEQAQRENESHKIKYAFNPLRGWQSGQIKTDSKSFVWWVIIHWAFVYCQSYGERLSMQWWIML